MRNGRWIWVGLANERSAGTSMPISARPARTAASAEPGLDDPVMTVSPGRWCSARAASAALAGVGAAIAMLTLVAVGRIA